MVKQIVLKSLSTGLVGLYPETHLGMDADLVPENFDPDCGCWLEVDPEAEAEPESEAEIDPFENDEEVTDGDE